MLTIILIVVAVACAFVAFACAFVAWRAWKFDHAEKYPEEREIPRTKTNDCKCYNPTPDNNTHSHDVSKITSASFIKHEKERIVTEDEIRYTAYLIASADNFSKRPETYWIEAEKQLKENNNG